MPSPQNWRLTDCITACDTPNPAKFIGSKGLKFEVCLIFQNRGNRGNRGEISDTLANNAERLCAAAAPRVIGDKTSQVGRQHGRMRYLA
jgi:hypothetical protein